MERWLTAAALCVAASLAGAQSQATKDSVQPSKPLEQAPAPTLPKVPGQEIDRVVAIVNGDLILDSDVDQERRFEAFQPYNEQSGRSTREQTIERLINRALILQQSKLTAEDPITNDDLKREVDDLRKNIPACHQYNCATDEGWKKFLASQGFTEEEFDASWKQRMQVLQFIEERFRQGIRISATDVKNYYDTKLLPEFAKQGAAPPKLEDVSQRIQEVLLEQQVSNLLSDWLKSLRAQGQVVVMHPGDAAP